MKRCDYKYFLTNLQYAQSFASLEETDAWVQKTYRSARVIIIHNTKGVELKPSPIHGIGCFATNVGRKRREEGSWRLLDVPAEGEVVFKQGDSVGIALFEDHMRTELGRFCNHSLDANAECVYDDTTTEGRMGLVPIKAIKQIEHGDEITLNYCKAIKHIDRRCCGE